MTVKQEPTIKKEPFIVPKIEPDSSKDRADPPGTDNNNNDNGSATNKLNKKKAWIFNSDGYDYQGKNPSIRVILALKSKRFNKKVVFSTFIDKLKNYILTNFDKSRDILPILDNLKGPGDNIKKAQPVDLTEEEKKV